MSLYDEGEGSPLLLAEVETTGLRNRSHKLCENRSRVMRMPTLPSSPTKLGAKFLALE